MTNAERRTMDVCSQPRIRRLLVGAWLLLLAAGCGGAEATVSGRVTLDNEPLERGTVTFVPQEGGTPGYGPIDSEGNYQVPSRGRAGLSPGRYAVTVVALDPSVIGKLLSFGKLGPQEYLLKTVPHQGRRVLLVIGGDEIGTLYGAYRLAEHLGVRFYLHGDVVPDVPIPWKLPELDEPGKPLFELRGLNPWGSHPFGFDLWNTDDYQAHIGQLAKMRMNFIGMHCYLEGHPYAEPTVWLGIERDFDHQGRVSFSYPSSYYNALFSTRWGGLRPAPTGRYHFGAAALFERDDWGPDVMRGRCPRPTTPQGCNEVFNRTGAMFREAFAVDHWLTLLWSAGFFSARFFFGSPGPKTSTSSRWNQTGSRLGI